MKKSVIVLLIVIMLGACSSEQEKEIYPINNNAESLKPIMQKQESIHGYKGVINAKDIVVAININRFDRFQKVKIEKKITKQIEKKFPDKKVLVTGDKKIMWEVETIIEKKMKEKDLKKSIKKIKSLSKEET